MDTIRIPVSGDPFYAARHPRDAVFAAPHACYEGIVFIGRITLTEDGEEE
jgi:hypothetical protein